MLTHEKSNATSKSNSKSKPNKPQNAQLMKNLHTSSIVQRAKMQPESLNHSDIMQLQRTIGNSAVCQLLKGSGAANLGLKPARKKEKQAERKASGKDVVQGKWYRMSTVLDEHDEVEVDTISSLIDEGKYVEAFETVVYKYPDLADTFSKIIRTYNPYVMQIVGDILQGSYNAGGKAYTAGEIIELMESNGTIAAAISWQNEMERLTERFSNMRISVPFYSDADAYSEPHEVYLENDVIMVASNPEPLTALFANKKWGNVPIPDANIKALKTLHDNAKKELKDIGDARTLTKMEKFRKTLALVADALSKIGGAAHQASLLPCTDLSGSANYNNNARPIEGKEVKAKSLCINSGKSGSPPKDGRLMDSIRDLAGKDSKSYVQMHLLNDLVFGPGELWNLTPGPKQSNVDMEANIEDYLKRAVLGKGLVIDFTAKVNYNHDPITASDKDIRQNPDKYRFQSISFAAKQLTYNSGKSQWETAPLQDPDVKAMNGAKVNWRYGSLPPLRPKPRILNPATTAQDLIDAGIRPSAANRIINFIANKPGWKLKGGKDKQKQLVEAVKDYDGESRIPDISTWKATDVLWT